MSATLKLAYTICSAGINAIMYYMSVLMKQIGFNKFEANYMSLVGGGSLLLGTIPAIFRQLAGNLGLRYVT